MGVTERGCDETFSRFQDCRICELIDGRRKGGRGDGGDVGAREGDIPEGSGVMMGEADGADKAQRKRWL